MQAAEEERTKAKPNSQLIRGTEQINNFKR